MDLSWARKLGWYDIAAACTIHKPIIIVFVSCLSSWSSYYSFFTFSLPSMQPTTWLVQILYLTQTLSQDIFSSLPFSSVKQQESLHGLVMMRWGWRCWPTWRYTSILYFCLQSHTFNPVRCSFYCSLAFHASITCPWTKVT